MKLEKFMVEITKALIKDKKVLFWQHGHSVMMSYNGFFGILIPEEKNVFNHEINNSAPIPENEISIPLMFTTECRKSGKETYNVMVSRNGKWSTYVNEKFIKYFDDDAEYFQENPKSAICVFENNVLCGVIMPYTREEFKND